MELIIRMYVQFHNNPPLIYVILMTMVFLPGIFVTWWGLFYLPKLKVYVDDENVTVKLPDKTTTFKIKDIYKIEKDFSYAGVGYYVFYYDEKRKKRHVKLNDNIAGDGDLMDYLQRKSGIKMRWEGTVDVKNEKRPLIKVLKIAWNIFIVAFVIGATVVYPIVAHSHREEEQRLHLPERSLWP